MIRHIAMMRWNEDTTDEQIDEVKAALATMPELIPQIKAYAFGSDLELSEGTEDFAVVADFASVEDYKTYANDQRHKDIITAHVLPIVDQTFRVQFTVD